MNFPCSLLPTQSVKNLILYKGFQLRGNALSLLISRRGSVRLRKLKADRAISILSRVTRNNRF